MSGKSDDSPPWLAGLLETAPARKAFLAGPGASYGELREQVGQARGLLRRLGIAHGDRVAVASGDDLAVALLYAACLTSGVTTVVLDPQASPSEITLLVGRARPKAVFADRAILATAGALAREERATLIEIAPAERKRNAFGLLLRRGGGEAPAAFPALLAAEAPAGAVAPADEDDCALILFTSGTTSQPKGVQLSFRNLAAQMATFQRHYGFDAESVVVNHLPLHHSDGLNQGPLLAFATGATLVRPGPVTMQTLGTLMDAVYRERATHLVTVPTVLAMMLRLPADYDDSFGHPGFRFVASTAGPLAEEVWRQVEARFRTMVVNSYGLTETAIEALYCGPGEDTRQVGTIGKPVDCEARIVDEEGREVAAGEAGELWLRGDNVMLGYLDQPEATAAVLRDGWLRTGDLATRDEDGFHRIVGRKKSLIVRGGINVYPEDVTAALLSCPEVLQAATVGVPDALLGEQVVGCVVPRSPGADPSQGAMDRCRAVLAPEKLPNRIVVLEALPFGPSGKVELQALRGLAQGVGAGSPGAGGSLAERVLDVAASVFQARREELSAASGDEEVAGWDSLNYLEFVLALERHFAFKMTPREVMGIRRLGDAIAVVERHAASGTDGR